MEDNIIPKEVQDIYYNGLELRIYLLGISKEGKKVWYIPPIREDKKWNHSFFGSIFFESEGNWLHNPESTFDIARFMEKRHATITKGQSNIWNLGEKKMGFNSELIEIAKYLEKRTLNANELSKFTTALLQADAIATVINNFSFSADKDHIIASTFIMSKAIDYEVYDERIKGSVLENLVFTINVIAQEIERMLIPSDYKMKDSELKDNFFLDLEKMGIPAFEKYYINKPFLLISIKTGIINFFEYELELIGKLSKIFKQLRDISNERRNKYNYHTKHDILKVLEIWGSIEEIIEPDKLEVKIKYFDITKLRKLTASKLRLELKILLNNTQDPLYSPIQRRAERILKFLKQ